MWNLGLLGASVGGADESSYELIETAFINSTTSSVSFDNLNSTYGSTYKHLEIRVVARTNRSSANQDSINLRVNNDTGANYVKQDMGTDGSSLYTDSRTDDKITLIATAASGSVSNAFGPGIMRVLDPFDSNKNTSVHAIMAQHAAGTGGGPGTYSYIRGGAYLNTNPVESLQLQPATGDMVAGTRISLYGLRGA